MAAQLFHDVEAVPPRQADVEDDQIRRVLERADEPRVAVARRADAVPLLAKGAVEHGDQSRVVLDDENRLLLSRVRHRGLKIRVGSGREQALPRRHLSR